jgi:hypothetical protein
MNAYSAWLLLLKETALLADLAQLSTRKRRAAAIERPGIKWGATHTS